MNSKAASFSIFIFAFSIVLGAFGAHSLSKVASLKMYNAFETAVRYQIYIALFTLVISVGAQYFTFRLKSYLLGLWGGLLLFSGSIYGLVIFHLLGLKASFLGPITPIGGLVMIVSAVFFGIKVLKSRTS